LNFTVQVSDNKNRL